MKRVIPVLIGVLVIIAIGSVAFRGGLLRGQLPSQEVPTFKLSVNTWVGFGPFYLAKEKGFFQEEGVNVDIVVIDDVGQKKAALKSGRIDALGDTIDSFALALDEGVPATAIAQLDISNGADGILATEDVQSVRDLKGKKIAAQKNFVSEAFLNYLLVAEGMSPSDVQVIDMEAGAAGAAFVSGQVDAAVTFEPWLSKAKERKGGKILVSSAQYPDILVDVLLVNKDYLRKNKDVIKGVLRAWFRAVQYAQQNPQEANAIMAKYYNVSSEGYAEFLPGLKWPSYEENLQYFSTGKAAHVAAVFSDVFLKTGQVKTKPDVGAAIDVSLLQSLYGK